MYELSSQKRATAPSRVVLSRSAGTSGGIPGEVRSDEHATSRPRKTGANQPRIYFLQRGIAGRSADRVPATSGTAGRRNGAVTGPLPPPLLSPPEDTLLLKGGLVVVKLQVRQIGQVDREVEGKIAVRIPHEVQAGTPLVKLSLQPDDL